MMTGRYSCGASAWRRNTNSSCPVCGCGWESLTHILLFCPCAQGPSVSQKRLTLLKLYTEEGLPLPTTPEELTSALLNGDRFLTRNGEIVEITDTENKERAQLLSSIICHQTHIKRDFMINAIIIDQNGTNLLDIVNNDLDETIPYGDDL